MAAGFQKPPYRISKKGFLLGSKLAMYDVPGHDCADSASVTATSHHAEVARVELDHVLNLAGRDVQLDGVVDLQIIKQ